MDEFVSEHGGVLISEIVSLILIVTILMVVAAAGNMDAYTFLSIAGEK